MTVLRLTRGTIFAGDFEIVGPLAEGGMGAVYVAKQLSTGKERALKIMQPQFVSDDRTRQRFAQEARAGSQVDSEHVIEVVAAGIDAASGIPWLAMELLRGEDLASFAERVGPIAVPQVLEIFRQLCHGLAAAHATGLVHRDLKPENVYLATARRMGVPFTVKILDFGIAKMVRETKHNMTDAVGTPTWMAPEQTEAGRTITPATDVWALGLIAFRLLTGVTYWRATHAPEVNAMAILREVVYEPMEPASLRAKALGSSVSLTADFDGWFARCVVRETERRFPHATSALSALEAALGSGVTAAEFLPMFAPLESAPPTVPGGPFSGAEDVTAAAAPALPPTQVGPFTAPMVKVRPGSLSSMPPNEDVDSYEQRLSSGKKWAWATAMALVTAGTVGAWQLRTHANRPAPFNGGETEPNNRAPEANALPFGEKVRGQIGQRLDADRSDRDFFRTTVPAGARLVQLRFHALPNIAPCLLWYRVGIDEPFARYCAGQPARDLNLPQIRIDPGDYYLAVLQDREQYTEEPPPPILENVSDAYELSLTAADRQEDLEVEPNDVPESAGRLKAGATLRGKLAWMHDVDIACAEPGTGPLQLAVEDGDPRPRGAVLEVTPIGGPGDGVPVRVHHLSAKGQVTERDARSPWTGPKIPAGQKACVSITLTRDIWSSPPMPRVAPAGDQEYIVRVEGQ
jgi:serine/threonine-protein kinase